VSSTDFLIVAQQDEIEFGDSGLPAQIVDARSIVNLSKIVSKKRVVGAIAVTWTVVESVNSVGAHTIELHVPNGEHKELIKLVTDFFKAAKKLQK